MAGFQAFERQLAVATAGISPEAISKLLAETAKKALADAIRSGEGSPDYTRYVNGIEGAAEETVKAPGPILYEFHWAAEMVPFILDALRERAPKRGGKYRESFVVLANGVQVDPLKIPAGAEIVIVNVQPYTRKIQVGAKGFTVYAGLFDDAARFVRRNWGQFVTAQVRFVDLNGGFLGLRLPYVLKKSGGRKGRRKGDPLTYPALVINTKQ